MNFKDKFYFTSSIIFIFVYVAFLILFIIGAIYFNMDKRGVANTDTHDTYIPVLMYHHFDETESASTIVPIKEFEEQMTYLQAQGYTAVTEEQILDFYSNGTPLPKKPIHITIDDGYTSNYLLAWPVLKETNMKATIFPVISQVGETPGSYPHFTWEEAQEMADSKNVELHSHTYNLHHKEGKTAALLYQKDNESKEEYQNRILEDLKKSKTEIEENTSTPVLAFSYPYGAHNEDVVKLVKEAGYKLAYTVKEGVNHENSDPLRLDRINVPGGWSGKDIVKAIEKHSK